MDNPFKEPPKGCMLCNVNVDYKNIQVNIDSSVCLNICFKSVMITCNLFFSVALPVCFTTHRQNIWSAHNR